ncbi:PAS domain-containing sensor histidine kinase [Sulfitobacter mediterraneus]|uniref:sensor histidine kinase NtrY-like n=1 Tax=Sulfitobacter mediterraneus TaxID=83219 RepID=UPI0019335E98|nr:PAS domain-containing sensor histidine kinase [Sulfitobacter mediterraneus]MBM1631993.1 PAS domain-containing sensor histidine kinase [Sulfitobacter mediterraneus]MBM1639808.1 PAS domain-containing sensor histidine kinase [Sulfitobacter mediterraneus]MBM1643857.1 PAS domain-containing sensor histidine kinase [Sulfitobacter mediterraneus]MBM1647903.1 PAS domain-containing sensor histidine kinase [Sulfitobacter mediterraneus]MBM1651948.1 PAS domain-containing sensor histidine kinase [Sulfitob
MRRVRNLATLSLVVLGPVLAMATYLALGPLGQGANTFGLRLILLTDLVYVLLVAALVLSQVARLIAARRAKSAGSRLHLRLTGVFALMALIPTVSVAVFAGLTVNVGLEGWFSDRVRSVVGNSLAAAQAYETEQREDLIADARTLARSIDNARKKGINLSDSALLGEGQRQIQRGLREAYLIDGTAQIRARGNRSYLFDYEQPDLAQIETASADGVLIIEDWTNNEFRALVPMESFVDRYLYVSREVDGEILSLLDETKETVRLYQQLEADRGRLLFEFALVYLGFAVILILAAVWLGLWFAERLSGPVGRLTGAAQQVGAGDLSVQVREEEGDDEIAMLGRYFNQMTRQLSGQRETLLDNTRQIERRRRLFDSVLSSVTSGVVGLDPEGRVAFVNRSAKRLLDWHEDQQSLALAVAVPEFGPLFETLTSGGGTAVQGEVKVSRQGTQENLLVRMAPRRSDDGRLEGYVVAFDDVTDLVSAQRMAAWGDVARRIAHEIKNPLTPIQLSAERIRRKFAPKLGEDSDTLEQMTGVIIRQTGDLRRIVDEFSKFARMPEPETSDQDLTQLVRDAVFLQQAGQPEVKIVSDLPDRPVVAQIDATMISQALTNLIKNAGEAIESLSKKGTQDDLAPRIEVTLTCTDNTARLTIADNGIGLPEDRARLFEPYVTTRSEGTGLGLPIVKKIIEEHGGTLTLENAPVFDGQTHFGAMAVISLPIAPSSDSNENRMETTHE